MKAVLLLTVGSILIWLGLSQGDEKKSIEEGGDPPRFGIFVRDAATVFVDAWHGPNPAPHGAWSAYFHCDDVAGLAADLRARDYPCDGPTQTVYGMVEVSLRDPDGNKLCFGQEAT